MKKIVLLLLTVFFCFSVNGVTYYSRTSGGNWSTPGTWSIVAYGGSSAASFPSTNDTAKIGNGYTVIVNTNSACYQLDIGQGTSGSVQYGTASGYSLTIGGNVTVNPGASLIYNSNFGRTHTLSIGGNLTNDGSVSLYLDLNDLVNVTFTGAATSTISGSGTWVLNGITVNKSTSATIFDVQVSAFETAITTLTLSTGTYIHDNSGSYSINASAGADFSIGQNVVFKVPLGTVTFSPTTTRLYLYGSLYVSGGNVVVGSTTGTNGIRYDKTGTNIPYLEVSAGALTVYGGITYGTGASSDPFSFNMTGGTILLNSGSTGTSNEVFNTNDVATSVFSMSGGTITIQNHNSGSGSNTVDWTICGSAGTVTTTGGTVEFGNSSTVTGVHFDFLPFPNAIQPSFKVTGAAGAALTLQPSKGSSANFKVLSLYIDANKTFDITSIAGAGGNNKIMTITSTFDGSSSFYNSGTFSARTGQVIFGGTSSQSVGGSTTTAFYDLKIDNPGGVILGAPVNVTDNLNMNSGILTTTSTNILTCTSSATSNIGSSSSYVDGPMYHTDAQSAARALTFPIGKGGYYRPVVLTPTHSNNTSVTYRCELVNSAAAALPYSLPGTLSSVSYQRYWLFTRAAVGNFSSATIQLYYGTADNITDSSTLRVAQDNGTAWANHGGTGTANGIGSITSSSFAFFNTVFTLANSAGSGSLPVRWLNFSAAQRGNKTILNWSTASEINNDYFSAERSSDGINFNELARVKGAGNSTEVNEYSCMDPDPMDGINYYRIRQVDFSGSSEFSGIIAVYMKMSGEKIMVAPTIVRDNRVTIFLRGMQNKFVEVRLYDISGTLLKHEMIFIATENEAVPLDIPPMHTEQSCTLNIAGDELMETRKIFILN